MLRTLVRPATHPIRRWVLGAFPRGQSGLDYDHPVGDAGLFGPDSVTWRIHADFPGMLSGGLSSLMLQALHPRALAGVYDHSNFHGDLVEGCAGPPPSSPGPPTLRPRRFGN